MHRVATGLPSKSAKIRKLSSAGYKRADIARFLDIRYQHVRNVLVKAEEKNEKESSSETAEMPPRQVWAQVGSDGRVVIPVVYRERLGLGDGGHILMVLEDDEVRLIGRDGAIARAQALIAPYVEDESTSAEAFLADRRLEAQREVSGG